MNMNYHDWMISEELHKWLLDNLESGSTILELGSGDGTEILSKHYKMFSIEHNIEWSNRFNSTYITAPLVDNWYNIDIVKSQLPKKYDLILIDGPVGDGRESRMGFYNNIELFNTGVTIIVDDTHRPDEKKLATKLSQLLNRESKEIKCQKKSFTII